MLPNPYLIGGVALAFLLLLGALGIEHFRLADAQHRLAAATQRADDLAQKVLQADEAVKQAGAINGRQAQALDAQTRAVAALKADADRQAESSRKALLVAAQNAQEARQHDAKRRAESGLPPVEEMQAALRDAVSGL